ncbi:hypothetical protein NC653_025130 [Populus alba x Populus x berolinensis]|uniref:Uncharacterized protein n=1 Tax=Populus alba x Populus x berolinensis TaxID=444605 RepID=A0AAD6Q8P5_9ROSI|nr:hypothetical protein NC653_025130 [Populus alba x Populus x berolinensis]
MDIYSFFLKIRGLVWSEPSKRQQMVAFHKYAPFSARITFYPVVNFQISPNMGASISASRYRDVDLSFHNGFKVQTQKNVGILEMSNTSIMV